MEEMIARWQQSLFSNHLIQVKRLLKAIYSPEHLYYVHVDQRQLYMLTGIAFSNYISSFLEMKTVAGLLPNVYVASDGHSTIWGGASLLSMVQGIPLAFLTVSSE